MSWAFLAVTLVGAGFTANAFRPVRIEPFTVPSFFAGWLTSELPLHHMAWQVVATAVFVALGALRGWPGWAGLGVAVVSWCGLVVLAVQAANLFGFGVLWVAKFVIFNELMFKHHPQDLPPALDGRTGVPT